MESEKKPMWCPSAGRYAIDGMIYVQAVGIFLGQATDVKCVEWPACRKCAAKGTRQERELTEVRDEPDQG